MISALNYKECVEHNEPPEANFKHIRKYLELEHFNADVIRSKNSAAAGLCAWVRNIVIYRDIHVKVEPLRIELAECNVRLAGAQESLAKAKESLEKLQALLDDLKIQFDQAEKDKADDDAPASDAPEEKFVLSNSIPMSESLDPLKILTYDAEVALWQSQNLPADQVSTENATIVANTDRWPVLIDPQLQPIAWIREKEKGNNLDIVRIEEKQMLRKLERAMENGESLMIENVKESLPAILNPIISRATVKKGRKFYVKLGDSDVELGPKFKLFLHTKLSNPHFSPEIQAECALINFTVTPSGLADQLLNMVVKMERPDLAEQRLFLIKQQNNFKVRMKELEDSILHKIATAEGDITEDRALIESLENTKVIANDIAKKQVIAAQTAESINTTSEKYRSVAERGSLLFFC
jgi:dynein heavy chain